MIRIFLISFFALTLGTLTFAGLRGSKFSEPPLQFVPDMKHQPKLITQHSSGFFTDGRGDRSPVSGTIPMGYQLPGAYYQAGANNLSSSSHFTNQPTYKDTGIMDGSYGDGVPYEVSKAFLARGEERFNIHCAVCHDRSGGGNGIVKTFGLVTIASLQDDRIRNQPDGQLFQTITHGKNTMGAYGPSIAVEDRWAIVAFVRVLQNSQNVKAAELRESLRGQLETK